MTIAGWFPVTTLCKHHVSGAPDKLLCQLGIYHTRLSSFGYLHHQIVINWVFALRLSSIGYFIYPIRLSLIEYLLYQNIISWVLTHPVINNWGFYPTRLSLIWYLSTLSDYLPHQAINNWVFTPLDYQKLGLYQTRLSTIGFLPH